MSSKKLVFLLFLGTFLIGIIVHSFYVPTFPGSLTNFRNSVRKIGIQDKQITTTSTITTQMATASVDTELKVFRMKHPGTCSGMFWRDDPRADTNIVQKVMNKVAGSKPDWPRNGALLKGRVFEVSSRPQGSLKWLEVTEYRQKDSAEWVATPGCFMQFEQGGTLLHEEKV